MTGPILTDVRTDSRSTQPSESDSNGSSRPTPTPARWRLRNAIVICSAWLGFALVFFRHTWTSGFDNIIGNLGDARLAVYLNEHWYLVLSGRSSWLNPEFFFPAKGVLGWTDTFFLYQLFYAPFRFLGADPFVALELTLIAASFVGFVSFVLLVNLLFRPPLGIAIAGGWLFAFANNVAIHAGSAQLLGVYFVPVAACLLVLALRSLTDRPKRSAVLFALFGCFYGLLLFSFYYVAWLSILAAFVLLIVRLALSPRSLVRQIGRGVRIGRLPILAGVGAFGLSIIPFLRTYVPTIHEFGGRRYSAVLFYAPTWKDVLAVGPNLYWSGIQGRIPQAYESTYTITPLLSAFVVVAGVAFIWMYRREVSEDRRRQSLVTIALCVTTVVLLILPIKTRFGSLWIAVWHLPGASALRASDRLEIVTGMIAAIAFVSIATSVFRRWQGSPRRSVTVLALGVILATALCCEQLNVDPVAQISRPWQLTLLRDVPSPPRACTSFFVTDSVQRGERSYVYQIDAMLISQKIDLPTLNGYSGENPRKWRLALPEKSNYLAFVKQWAELNHIRTGVCELDIGRMKWTTL